MRLFLRVKTRALQALCDTMKEVIHTVPPHQGLHRQGDDTPSPCNKAVTQNEGGYWEVRKDGPVVPCRCVGEDHDHVVVGEMEIMTMVGGMQNPPLAKATNLVTTWRPNILADRYYDTML